MSLIWKLGSRVKEACFGGIQTESSPVQSSPFSLQMLSAVSTLLLMLPCLFQTVLDSEDRKLQRNVRQELSSNCFNYGAYHTLEAVSISEQVKIRSLAFWVL